VNTRAGRQLLQLLHHADYTAAAAWHSADNVYDSQTSVYTVASVAGKLQATMLHCSSATVGVLRYATSLATIL